MNEAVVDPGVDVVEQFYGVYLLYSRNPKYMGRIYIGFTTDPNRRIEQHNKGTKSGGAWKTSNRGPWEMVLVVHGFPNEIAALRFEWAWQHPLRSRRLSHVSRKKAKEKSFDYHLRLLWEMLLVGPWNRLPLQVRWLNLHYKQDYPADKCPPMHMPICQGPVKSKPLPKTDEGSPEVDIVPFCYICGEIISDKRLSCLRSSCSMTSHIICLSKHFLEKEQYVPIQGKCPKCKGVYLWGDIIRKYKGCYSDLQFEDEDVDRMQ